MRRVGVALAMGVLATSTGVARADRSATASCPGSTQTADEIGLERLKAATACLLRAEREDLRAGPVATDARLGLAARRQAEAMVAQGFFDHVGPDGRVLRERLDAVGWIPRRGSWGAGEILALGTGPLGSPEALVDGWLHSPGHFAILRDPDYDRMGVGLAVGTPQDGPDGLTAAVEFGRRTTR